MGAPFGIYRILCSTPPELEGEREIFESALSNFGEAVTFPQHVLFAGASFRDTFDAVRHRAAAEANIRQCDFFLHIFSETWPATAFQGFIELAQSSIADPAKPMRRMAVLFRNFAHADEQVRLYRDALAGAPECDLREFQDAAELDALLHEIFASWWETVKPGPDSVSVPTAHTTALPIAPPPA
jgi:hypothetical protein